MVDANSWVWALHHRVISPWRRAQAGNIGYQSILFRQFTTLTFTSIDNTLYNHAYTANHFHLIFEQLHTSKLTKTICMVLTMTGKRLLDHSLLHPRSKKCSNEFQVKTSRKWDMDWTTSSYPSIKTWSSRFSLMYRGLYTGYKPPNLI